jgi:gliding motility-associated-like protein
MKLIKVTAVLLTLVCCQGLAKATHIVGGDFYYEKLGSKYYRITLKLYIDCFKGSDSAIAQDVEGFISIFDAGNNKFEESYSVTRTGPVSVNKRQYKCVIPDPNACVNQYTYVISIFLDPGTEGKILSFQRCCRNNTIENIIRPDATGATYWVKIPGSKVVQSDNSPIFKELPPNYLCVGAPLVFDHSAVDPDGDSLVYELYQPFLGATKDEPRPNNAGGGNFANPPFEKVIWRSPFNTNNQMGGQPILQIDSKTGELTVTPNLEGQFVIGIKVKEFRNGVFIGETLRDYQFNVRPCQFDLISVFFVPAYSCENTISFENKSYKAVEYFWDFGDPTTDKDVSTEINPNWTYPGNGDYYVSLKAKNLFCEDTYMTKVRIRSKITVDLGPDLTNCKPIERTISTKMYDVTKTEWSTGQTVPLITIKDSGTYWARVFYGNCTAIDTVRLYYYPISYSGPNDTVFCDSVKDTLTVFPLENLDLKYRWNNSLKDTFSSYIVNSPGIYTIQINNGPCLEIDTVKIWISGKPKIGPYYFVCNEFEKTLDAGDFTPPANYLWSDGSTGRYMFINKEGLYWIKVSQGRCDNLDTLIVENPVIPLELGPDRHFCDSVSLYLNSLLNMERYQWNDLSNLPDLYVNKEGKYWVEVFDTNGCQKSDTITIDMTESPTIHIGNDTTICFRSAVELGTKDDFFDYSWNNGSTKRKITIQDAGVYVLIVTDAYGCKGIDTVNVKVDINALPNELYIPNAFSPNGDELNEYFPFTEKVVQPEFSLMIFNRWGEKLFDSKTETSDHWDGVYKNGVIRPDAFVYLVEYRGCDGDYRRKFGTVTVLK